MSKEAVFVVKIGNKEVEINEKTLSVLREYLKTPMGLDELAQKLGLESWEEAYEFLKAVPAWILWMPPSLWRNASRWILEKQEGSK
ncbi:hypothetical protein ACSU1N_01635 [Thermogladius sp. 4427co]|uniref:hypothetical protein n=1 Tax=Thermogladius sp. 4427co TaxID=3450718 RepID=UPI003F7B0322